MNGRSYNQFCALAYGLDVVGDRWTLLIIRELLAGPRRFTDLIEWVLDLPNFEGVREDCSEGHLEQIQAKWVYEWRDNQ